MNASDILNIVAIRYIQMKLNIQTYRFHLQSPRSISSIYYANPAHFFV